MTGRGGSTCLCYVNPGSASRAEVEGYAIGDVQVVRSKESLLHIEGMRSEVTGWENQHYGSREKIVRSRVKGRSPTSNPLTPLDSPNIGRLPR